MRLRRTRRAYAASALALLALCARPHAAHAAPLHPTVSLRAQYIAFYAGHLVLDGRGDASIDDGILRVHADRIIIDLRDNRYLAVGSLTVTATTVAHGDALGIDLATHQGLLVNTAQQPVSEAVAGDVFGGPVTQAAGAEPLALPDVGSELPYARASRAVAHLGADVRLSNAHIIVPGGESVGLPSYVYTFSIDPGYSITNISTGGEDVPIYYGSTTDSIEGIHFFYNSVTKLGIGLDSHFVWGNKSYILVGASPLYGPTKALNFTWQEHMNDHVTQTFTSSTLTNFGTENAYDLRDSIHRSFLDLAGFQGLGSHGATLGWQSFDQPFGAPGGSRPYFHLRSEYGYTHVPNQFPFAPFLPDAQLPRTVWHSAFEGYLGSQTWDLGRNVSLYGIADLRDETDDLPHRQVLQDYTLTLQTTWNRNVSTLFSNSALAFFDAYPSVNSIFHSRVNSQSLSFRYDHGDPFALSLALVRSTVVSDNPSAPFAYPWTLFGDVRFRVTRSLSLDLSREYFFGYNGQRFGSIGFQILP